MKFTAESVITEAHKQTATVRGSVDYVTGFLAGLTSAARMIEVRDVMGADLAEDPVVLDTFNYAADYINQEKTRLYNELGKK